MNTSSPISQFFAEKNIFVTGGTGFLGRILIEKLLRSCPNIGKIYMLIRTKKNKTPEERLKEYFEDPLYGLLKEQNEAATKKIILMVGDCCLPDLGLDEASKSVIISEVNCIFHCAATVRFTEKLGKATAINVRATMDLLKLAKGMINLQAFVHVSTAYAFCTMSTIIEERMYKPGIKAEDLLHLVEMFEETRLEQMLPGLLGDWPKTYTFTKAAAEEFVYREGNRLPVVILRPSIIVQTYEEPLQGWINNIYGIVGMVLGFELGVLRVVKDLSGFLMELVPADYVANSIISSAWDVSVRKPQDIKSSESQVPIYNCCVPTEEQITFNEANELAKKFSEIIPSTHQVWHRVLVVTNNAMLLSILTVLLQTIPAYMMDFVSRLRGKKTTYAKLYKKLDDHMTTVSYFYNNNWIFNTDEMYALFDRMAARDKELFNFNMRRFDWELFGYRFAFGGRRYLLKESDDTIPAALRKRVYLKIAHYALVTTLSFVTLGFLYLVVWTLALWNFQL